MEIRTSAQEQWDEAEVILEDCAEWHDRNNFLLWQRWRLAILFKYSCVPLTESRIMQVSCIKVLGDERSLTMTGVRLNYCPWFLL